MAEFCLECWNRINETNHTPEGVKLTKYPDLCEGCGEIKRVVQAPFFVLKRRLALVYLARSIFILIRNAIRNLILQFRWRK